MDADRTSLLWFIALANHVFSLYSLVACIAGVAPQIIWQWRFRGNAKLGFGTTSVSARLLGPSDLPSLAGLW
jgi:hypothetical protein